MDRQGGRPIRVDAVRRMVLTTALLRRENPWWPSPLSAGHGSGGAHARGHSPSDTGWPLWVSTTAQRAVAGWHPRGRM